HDLELAADLAALRVRQRRRLLEELAEGVERVQRPLRLRVGQAQRQEELDVLAQVEGALQLPDRPRGVMGGEQALALLARLLRLGAGRGVRRLRLREGRRTDERDQEKNGERDAAIFF